MPSLAASDIDRSYAIAIKRLGRNARGDEDGGAGGVLDAELMSMVWTGLLAQRYTPAQEAALLMGLRVHGESAAMLDACARASAAFITPVATGAPTVVLHCYGTARKQPSLAPLLALRLREHGLRVLLIVGSLTAARSSAAVLAALSTPAARACTDAAAQLAADGLAAMTLEALSPALARVLHRRSELGFRNTAHTALKLVAAVIGPAVLVSHYTHGEYRGRLAAAIESLQLTALLVRGTEGDPVAWDGDAHPPRAWRAGIEQPVERRVLPRAGDPQLAGDDGATAAFCRRAAADAALVPPAIEQQARQLAALARSLETP